MTITLTRGTIPAWSRFGRWVAELRRDLDAILRVPIHRISHEWRARRALHRLIDERLSAWRALPPEEQLDYVHPSSPTKPPGWTLARYKKTQRRRDGAH